MLTLTAVSDQSDIHLGSHGWAVLLLALVIVRVSYIVGVEVGATRMRREILRHPSVRARRADKQISEVA